MDIAMACGEDSTTSAPKISFLKDVKTGAWRVHVASKRFAKKYRLPYLASSPSLRMEFEEIK